jgi:hypothetical protein
VEKREAGTAMCSACAGDYEDPDRTAWEEDPEEIEEVTDELEVAGRSESGAEGGGDRKLG